jgi:hypothetical protein
MNLHEISKAILATTHYDSVLQFLKIRRWAGHVARMGIRGTHIGYWFESQKERDD